MLKVPDEGCIFNLDQLITVSLNTSTLHLYKADIPIAFNMTLADILGIECDFSGYAALALTTWTPSAMFGIRATTYNNPLTFTHNGGGISNSVYGYFIVDPTATLLLAVEEDQFGPVSMAALGDPYRVIASYTLRSEY